MRECVQLRWIEQAEARSVREYAGLYRAPSEPGPSIVFTEASASLSGRNWKPNRTANRALLAARSLLRRMSGAAMRRSSSQRVSTSVEHDRVLATLLITDIVDSTRWVTEMGDRDWRSLLNRHNDAIRGQIARFAGREVGNPGDGFISIFDSPTRAIHCAAAITRTIAPLGLTLRSGIHVGEVYLKDRAISGRAVHVAARIASAAIPGEAYVSQTVCDLVAGSGLTFEDRGVHRLRGLPEQIHLYAMCDPAPLPLDG